MNKQDKFMKAAGNVIATVIVVCATAVMVAMTIAVVRALL